MEINWENWITASATFAIAIFTIFMFFRYPKKYCKFCDIELKSRKLEFCDSQCECLYNDGKTKNIKTSQKRFNFKAEMWKGECPKHYSDNKFAIRCKNNFECCHNGCEKVKNGDKLEYSDKQSRRENKF